MSKPNSVNTPTKIGLLIDEKGKHLTQDEIRKIIRERQKKVNEGGVVLK